MLRSEWGHLFFVVVVSDCRSGAGRSITVHGCIIHDRCSRAIKMQTSASLRTDLIFFAASVSSQMCFLGSADNWHAAMFIILFLPMLWCRFGLPDADQTLVVQCPSLNLRGAQNDGFAMKTHVFSTFRDLDS